MDGFCRGCLIQYDQMELLQYTEKNRRLFVYSTGLQVKRNDTFTFQLCKECFLNMKVACKFKKHCRLSDKRFKNYLALKDEGVSMDFCTFLKNTEEPFRFPLLSANSTPAHQKNKDDDNESTCTSIRNFMSEILKGEEMPDTEARIIREVIEEEADVLDDSLDSHWLQDDMSIDTDFKLDFSFSAFSTPHSINNDNRYTPKHHEAPLPLKANKTYLSEVNKNKRAFNDDHDYDSQPFKDNQPFKYAPLLEVKSNFTQDDSNDCKQELNDNDCNEVDDVDPLETHTNDFEIKFEDTKVVNAQNFYIPQDDAVLDNNQPFKYAPLLEVKSIDFTQDSNTKQEFNDNDSNAVDDFNISIGALETHTNEFEIPNEVTKVINAQNFYIPQEDDAVLDSLINLKDEKECSIDKNLAIALKDQNNQEFCLDDLLISPAYKNAAAFTPTITDLLFGDKNLDNSNQVGQCIENYDNVEGDMEIFEEFFQNDTKSINNELTIDIEKESKEAENHVKVPSIEIFKTPVVRLERRLYDLENLFCYLCNKKYKSLTIHLAKQHNINISKDRNPNHYATTKVCPFCAMKFFHRSNFHRHLKNHKKTSDTVKTFECDECHLECTSKAKLRRHLQIHGTNTKTKSEHGYLCTVCSRKCSDWANLNAHMRRHNKDYRYSCHICTKQFYFPSELKGHMRDHTGERPFQCKECLAQFKRRKILFVHVKRCHSTFKPECHHCGAQFTHKRGLRGHFRKSRSCKMVMTIKRKKKKPKPKKKEAEPIKIEVNITYAGDNETIISQLPFIETERSN